MLFPIAKGLLMMNDDLLSASQAADYLGVSRVRINQLANLGRIKREEIGGYYLYRRSELDRWRESPKSVGGRPKNQPSSVEINRGPEYVSV